MKWWFAGSRDVDEDHAKQMIEYMFEEFVEKGDTIRTGGARGVDTLVEEYVMSVNRRHKKPVYGLALTLEADWDKHRRRGRKNPAGMIRNEEGVKWADGVLALWDNESPGTKHVIKCAREQGKKLKVIII